MAKKVRMTKVSGQVWYSIGDISERIHGNKGAWHNMRRYRQFRENTIMDIHPSTDNLMRFMSSYDVLKALAVPYRNPKHQRIADSLAEQISNRLNMIEESREEAGVQAPSVYQVRDAFNDTSVTKTEIDNRTTNAQKEHNTMATANTVHPSANSAELIPLTNTDPEGFNNGNTAVMGRDLHEFLGIKAQYVDWFKRMTAYGFSKGQDYVHKIVNVAGQDGISRKMNDHIMTLDMAKEVAMIQRTDRGKQARQYFIAVEKEYKKTLQPQLPGNYVEALKALVAAEEDRAELTASNKQLTLDNHTLNNEVMDMSPKAERFDAWIDGEGVTLLGNAAKILDQGRNILGQNRLFNFLYDQGILIKGGGRHRSPRQEFARYFRMKTYEGEKNDGQKYMSHTTYVTPEGIAFIADRLRDAGYEI